MTDMEKAKTLIHLFYVIQKKHIRGHNQHDRNIMKDRDIMALGAVSMIQQRQDDLLKMSDISEYFHVTPAAISQMVRGYEANGWVERVYLEHDRRSVYLKITPSAKALLEKNEKMALSRFTEFIEYLGKEDSDALIRILEKAKAYGPIMPPDVKERKV